VTAERDGRIVRYRLIDPSVAALLDTVSPGSRASDHHSGLGH
jgi:hypothetical protein